MSGRFNKKIVKKTKKGMRGYPIATIAFYGPTNRLASKVVCSIFQYEGAEPDPMKSCFLIKMPEYLKKYFVS